MFKAVGNKVVSTTDHEQIMIVMPVNCTLKLANEAALVLAEWMNRQEDEKLCK